MEIKISGKTFRTPDAIKVIGLDTFVQLGADSLKRYLGIAGPTPQVTWSFEGEALPSLCHEDVGHHFARALMNSGAYPGPCKVFRAKLEHFAMEGSIDAAMLLVDAGLVVRVGADGFQMSERGFEVVKYDRTLNEFSKFFTKRDCSIENMSSWELMDHLEEDGWRPCPRPLRQRLPVLKLDVDFDDADKQFFFNRRALDVGKPYLSCLMQLAARQRFEGWLKLMLIVVK